MAFVKAVREKVYLKALLTGPSGSGKSWSALELATGIARKCGSDIAYIGTEGDRDKLYAQKKSKHGDYTFEYDLLQLTDPFNTDKYIAAINEAIDAGYKIIIVDSLSAEWQWMNDVHNKMPGNSFTNWGKLKPKHRELVDKILAAPAHIICCARGKDEWTMEDKNGKQVPKKVGLGSQTDKDISYEMMLSIQIDQDTHIAHADKDNTGLWDENRYTVITSKDVLLHLKMVKSFIRGAKMVKFLSQKLLKFRKMYHQPMISHLSKKKSFLFVHSLVVQKMPS